MIHESFGHPGSISLMFPLRKRRPAAEVSPSSFGKCCCCCTCVLHPRSLQAPEYAMVELAINLFIHLVNRFRSGDVSPRLPLACPEIDQILKHKSDSAAHVLLTDDAVDVPEVQVEWRQTLKDKNHFLGSIYSYRKKYAVLITRLLKKL